MNAQPPNSNKPPASPGQRIQPGQSQRRLPQGGPAGPSTGEVVWRNTFFYFSAFMGALALVDFDAGRIAHGMGDAGVASLLLSLLPQFAFVRAVVGGGGAEQDRARLLAAAERFRTDNPWSDRFSRAGWMLLLSSFVLRVLGVS